MLAPTEAPGHPHNQARQSYLTVDGTVQPAPAPRFSRTPGAVRFPPAPAGQHTRDVLTEHGFSAAEISALMASGVAAEAVPVPVP